MTETLVPWAPGARYMHVLCRLGVARADTSADADANPDLRTQGGSVVIDGAVRRFRYVEADGRARMISVPEMPFTIQASTGELIDAEGNVGLYLLDTSSPGVDPASFTWRARIAPTVGEAWEVVFPGAHSGDIDLAAAASITPTTGNVQLDARVAALEAGGVSAEDVQAAVDAYLTSNPVTGSGAYPVQQVALTGNLAYSLPADAPTDQVVSVVFTQDGTGGHTVTYGGQPVTVALAAGASTLVEIWPGGRITYPGSPLAQIGTLVLPEAPRPGETVTFLADASTVFPVGTRWDAGGEPVIDVYDELFVSLTWRGDVWLGTYGLPIPIPDTTAPTPGTLAASAITDTSFTLTASGATDDRVVTGYAFDTGAGTFGNYQTSPVLAVAGKTAGTTYTCRHKARDAAGNEATGASIQVRTVALPAAIMALTPAAYWKLDEATGTTAADSSGNGLNGTYTGTVTLGGAEGPLLGGGYIEIPDAASLSLAGSAEGFSIFAIASRTNSTYPNRQFLITKAGNGFEWQVEVLAGSAASGIRAIAMSSAGDNLMGDATTGPFGTTWQGVCVAMPPYVNGARIPIYKNNGTAITTTQTSIQAGNPSDTISPVRIGVRSDVPADFWSGRVRHVAIFRKQLSAAEVGVLMDAARGDGLIP